MSFSTDIKKELSEINNLAKKEQVKYELLGYLLSNNIEKNGKYIKFSTENEYNINRFAKLLRNVNINDFKIEIQGKVYTITVRNIYEKFEKNLNIRENETDKEKINNKKLDKQTINDIDEKLFIQNIINEASDANEENVRAFVRGLFMGSGSINDPNNKYHLEIKIPNKDLAIKVIEILKKYDINVKSINFGIYIKEGEEISKFLAFIGASKSVLEFEQIRVQRDMNNKINRLVNCKTANLNKVINASVEQINAIKKLKETGKFSKIDKALQELAELRLEFPDMPLSELGTRLKNPIGKSGVNYRMKKIIELAK